MLLFESDKQKLLEFNPIEAKNVSLDKLKYFLRIDLGEGIEFGFPGTMNEETKKIVFTLPPLSELVNYNLDEDGYSIRLEVVEHDKKFFDVPWSEKVKFKTSPKIKMEMEDRTEKEATSIQLQLTEDRDIELTESVNPTIMKKKESTTLDDVGKDVKMPGWFSQKSKG